MTPAERITALEAEFSRLKERADTLDQILKGSSDEWLSIQEKLGSEVTEVTINAPLAEARQTALAMATVLKSLASLGVGKSEEVPTDGPADQVAAAREKKLKEAQARAAEL